MELKDRIATARRAIKPKLTQAEVARQLDVTPQAVSGWERGEAIPEADKFPLLAKILQKDLAWLHGENSTEMDSPPPNIRAAELPPLFPRDHPQDVPVYGVAAGGAAADFYLNGEVTEHVRRPPGISSARGIFALYVVGTSMVPRFEEGELLYVSSSRPAAVGDYVVVELHPAEDGHDVPGYVKRLVRRSATKITCEQFNPPKKVEFDSKRVKAIYRVFPLNELMGI